MTLTDKEMFEKLNGDLRLKIQNAVRIIDEKIEKLTEWKLVMELRKIPFENISPTLLFNALDLVNSNSINLIPPKCEYILHLAGQSSGELSYKNPIDDLNKNTISTLNLINYGIDNKVKKFLFASSMSVYGDFDCSFKGVKEKDILEPKSCYGIGKLSSEIDGVFL